MGTFWAQPKRLINTMINAFVHRVPDTFGKAVFRPGQSIIDDLEGGLPTWVYAEFPTLAAFATDDTVMALPSDFVLLGMSGLTVTTGTPADFRVQIYDINGEIDFIPGKAANAGNISGNQGAILISRNPHIFRGSDPQCEVRIANRSNAVADVQFALFGLQGVCR